MDKKFSLSTDYGFGFSGKNIKSYLKWENISDKVVQLAITIFDPDAPTRCGFWNWILVGIDNKFNETTDEYIATFLQIQNDFGSYSYGGLCPPENDHPHRYFVQSMG